MTILVYERPSGTNYDKLYVEPTAKAIEAAEKAGWVAPDPETFKLRCEILEAQNA